MVLKITCNQKDENENSEYLCMPLRVEKIRKVVKSRVSGIWGQRKILPTPGGVATLEGHRQCLVQLSPDPSTVMLPATHLRETFTGSVRIEYGHIHSIAICGRGSGGRLVSVPGGWGGGMWRLHLGSLGTSESPRMHVCCSVFIG